MQHSKLDRGIAAAAALAVAAAQFAQQIRAEYETYKRWAEAQKLRPE